VGLTLACPDPRAAPSAATVVLPPPLGRKQPCPCGSGRKYKRCCWEHDESIRRQLRAAALPDWILHSKARLHQFEKYACQGFALPQLLASLSDSRRRPDIPTFDVVNSLFHTALLRIPSLNALEGDLQESDFQKLIGRRPTPEVKAFSADVVANVLDKLHLGGVRCAIQEVIDQAERNKVFREGSYGALRCVAIDGWEPFSSSDRHCPHCLVRHLKLKRASGETEEVEQYYHRYVVAMLLGPVVDVVLAIEPVLNEEARRDLVGEHAGHEGELTAARRLVQNLHQRYGGFIDLIVGDALYANGPFMTLLQDCGYDGVLVLKKENNEPFQEALALWQGQPGCETYQDCENQEQVEFWDAYDIQTLDTYRGELRVLRAQITKPAQAPTTWCFALVGRRARRLSRRTGLKVGRARWHIEDTGFNQWIQYWNLGHVFRHTANALLALLLLWTLAFNLLQLFVYRRLKRPRRPKDPTNTIRHIVEVMLREVATLPAPIPWTALLNTS
jgi:SEC-C motif